jgi:hypothetical protein
VIAAEAGIGGLAVCANGATLFDLDRDVIVRHTPLAAETAHRLVRGLRGRVPGIVFGWELELRFGSEPAYEALRDPSWWPRPDGSFPPCDPLEWRHPMTKLLGRLAGADPDEVLAQAQELAGADAVVTLTGNTFVEFMAPGVSKEAALAELARAAAVGRGRVVAFGDHVTDAGMLTWAGLGVAMGNAHPEALAAADEVTAPNDADGVALVLERLLAERRMDSRP